MHIRLRIFGSLQDYFGGEHHEVELPEGATLRDLLDQIDARWGEALSTQYWDAEARRFINAVQMMADEVDIYDDDALLFDQQQIYILRPLAGG